MKFAVLIVLAFVGSVEMAKTCPDIDVDFQDYVDTATLNCPVPPSLAAHSAEFDKQIIPVTTGIYCAIGYGLSNIILVETPDGGDVIIDTGDSEHMIDEVLSDFNTTRGKPLNLTAIIFTHNHPDHISGAKQLVKNLNYSVDVWGYSGIEDEFWSKWMYARPQFLGRGFRQVGILLPEGAHNNSGIGIGYNMGNYTGLMLVAPNRNLDSDSEDITIGGLDMTLLYQPGETRDQIAIQIPSRAAIMVGDNYYKTFPNLYAIRGTPPRPVRNWAASVEMIRDLNCTYLVPSHTKPLTGVDNIYGKLTYYKDAIYYVHDQTVRWSNRGLHPQEVARKVVLPANLKNAPQLQEFYGTVEWSVKTVFEGLFGWFSGKIEELLPLTPKQRAERWIAHFGVSSIYNAAKDEYELATEDTEEYNEDLLRSALEMVSMLWVVDESNDDVRALRANIAIALASLQTSANGRNYLLYFIREENCLQSNPGANDFGTYMKIIPFNRVFLKMATTLIDEDVYGLDHTTLVNITDGSAYSLRIYNSILQTKEEVPTSPDLTIHATELAWRLIMAAEFDYDARDAMIDTQIANNATTVTTGSVSDYKSWLRHFEHAHMEYME